MSFMEPKKHHLNRDELLKRENEIYLYFKRYFPDYLK